MYDELYNERAMKLNKNLLKKVRLFLTENYLITIFLLIVFIVGSIVAIKLIDSKDEYIYTKVKVSQGLWWASTQRPQYWYSSGLKKGLKELTSSGNIKAEIVSVEIYPSYLQDQYESFLTVRMKVEKNPKLNTYTFNRGIVAVAAPVEFNFTNVQVTGTVLDISEKPFVTDYIKKTVVLQKPYAYPWEYDQIKEGSSYNNGEETVFTVISKEREPVYFSPLNVDQVDPEVRDRITVVAEVLVEEQNGYLLFTKEQMLQIGKPIIINTGLFYFNDYIVVEVF